MEAKIQASDAVDTVMKVLMDLRQSAVDEGEEIKA